jgi:hypothetical protein
MEEPTAAWCIGKLYFVQHNLRTAYNYIYCFSNGKHTLVLYCFSF